MQLSLRHKALGLAAGAAVLPVAVMVGLTWQFKAAIVGQAAAELQALGRINLEQIARQMYTMCESVDATVELRMDSDIRMAQERVARTSPSNAVEEISRATGRTATVLRRAGEGGDLEVMATTVADPVRRAAGTSIAAADPAGEPNPLVAAILRGEIYRGPAELFDPSPVMACAPVRDGSRISGAVCIGARPAVVEALRKGINGAKVGKTGYSVVIGAKGNRRGRLLVAQTGRRDGENIWDTRDARGNYFVQEHVTRALKAGRGEIWHETYPWRNPGDDTERVKMAAEVYFEPWDWLINVGTFEDDYYASLKNVEQAFNSLLVRLALAATAALALVLWCAGLLSGRLARPLAVSARVAKGIAAGDIRKAREEITAFTNRRNGAGDEGHALIESFVVMAGNLDGLIGQVSKSAQEVKASALKIATSARELEATVAEQASSTREVTATTREISATSADLLATMGGVGETVAETGARTESRRAELHRMEEAMSGLLRSTSSVGSRLGIISDRANKISGVVTTINKISDQTSLLALNAAIEAEKAGEYGKGFSVVAREISRLADQTAVATQDIESVIREMQSSVSSGVMEMDKFAKEVGQRTGEVSSVAQQLSEIIQAVQAVGPRFDTVNQGMQAQTEGAQQISEAMTQLSQSADQTRQSLYEFKQATEHLNLAVKELEGEVARFQISG